MNTTTSVDSVWASRATTFHPMRRIPVAATILIFLGAALSPPVSLAGVWTTGTLSQPRNLPAATSAGSKVFFAGGEGPNGISDLVDIYDNVTNTWNTANLSQPRRNIAAASLGNKVFFAGGFAAGDLTDVVDVYDSTTNTWSTNHLSQARADVTAVTIGDKILFAGGQHSTATWPFVADSDIVDVYDGSTDTWSTVHLSRARSRTGGVSAAGKAFFAGGAIRIGNGGLVASDVMDVYDSATNAWTTKQMPGGRFGPSSASNGNFLFFSDDWNVDSYDIVGDSWGSVSLSQSRLRPTVGSVCGEVLFAGGAFGTAVSDVTDIYDSATDTWAVGHLSQARELPVSATLGNQLFFAGGVTHVISPRVLSDVVDIYTVPEPATVTTLLLGAAFVMRRRVRVRT